MANVWSGVTIDCLDPERVARFWGALLGREPGPSQEGWVYLGERGDPQPRLVFQPVPEPRTGKVRLHLDIAVDHVGEAMATVIDLGGRYTGERHDHEQGAVVVMADPEGNEFCLVEYYDGRCDDSPEQRKLVACAAVREDDVRMSGTPEGFTYRLRRNGDVEVLHHGRPASVLRGAAAARFLVDVDSDDPQELMARLTGNYKHGNERTAKRHPRNQDR